MAERQSRRQASQSHSSQSAVLSPGRRMCDRRSHPTAARSRHGQRVRREKSCRTRCSCSPSKGVPSDVPLLRQGASCASFCKIRERIFTANVYLRLPNVALSLFKHSFHAELLCLLYNSLVEHRGDVIQALAYTNLHDASLSSFQLLKCRGPPRKVHGIFLLHSLCGTVSQAQVWQNSSDLIPLPSPQRELSVANSHCTYYTHTFPRQLIHITA